MKFIVRTKNGCCGDIKEDVVKMLEKNGAKWTDKITPGCDFALIIGGDGTLLRDHWELDCPALGINPGSSIGFYMLACKNDFGKRILSLINGRLGKDYFIHNLTMLEASVNGKRMDATALNEVLVNPVYMRRIMESTLEVNGRKSAERNSAIIVYTPTGSNAFAHSAGAKALRHDSGRFGVIAVAPYSGQLKKKDLVLNGGEVRIECGREEGEVALDGSELHVMPLRKGDIVTVRKSPETFRLIGFKKHFH
jgi:NAD kinase